MLEEGKQSRCVTAGQAVLQGLHEIIASSLHFIVNGDNIVADNGAMFALGSVRVQDTQLM